MAEPAEAAQITVRVRHPTTGESVAVKIEPHATVSMLKQRVAYIVKTHEKQQTLKTPEHGVLDDIAKLEDLGIGEGAEVELVIPEAVAEELVVLSDDEGLVPPESDPPATLPEEMAKELTDEEQDRQASLKGQAAEAMEDGNLESALEFQTGAILLGPNAMMLCKRAEILLKLKRPSGAVADATAALSLNPDSCKAYRIRGKALRQVGEYERALEDLGQAQRIDYDDAAEEMLKWLQARCNKMRRAAQQAAAAAG